MIYVGQRKRNANFAQFRSNDCDFTVWVMKACKISVYSIL